MKKLFNHTKRPDRNWEEDVQDGYDWDEEQDGGEYYADDEEYTDEEYTGEEDGGEYYADDEEYTDEEYTGEEDGEEYYADDEEYTDEEYIGEEDGEEYYADSEEYTGEEDGEEYYADDEEYIGDEDGEEYYADDEEYTGDEDGEEYYADDEEYIGDEDGEEYYAGDEEYYADDDMAPARGGKGKKSKKQGGNKIAAIWTKFLNMSTMDRIMTATGVAVLILAIVTGSVYASARMVDHQVSEFVSVGSQLDGIQMIGEQGMLAVADAKLAKIAAANAVDDENEEQKEYDEAEYTNGGTVELELVSVQKDLKIKFTNKKSGKLISNVPFSVTITDPKGKSDTWTDDDMDGIIYKKGITPGNYTVAVNTLTDEKYKDYTLPTGTQKVEVRKDIAYKKVDVANEIKKESEVNAAKEDTMKNDTVVESILEDTVQWVESKKLPPTYREVAKDTVVNPEKQTAYSGKFLRIADAKITIKKGETKTLTPPDAGATDMKWSSSNLAIATVDEKTGVLTGKEAGGPVTITCTYTVPASATPSPVPSTNPTATPTTEPTATPTTEPTATPTTEPTATPTSEPAEETPTPTPSSNESQAATQSMGSGSLPVAFAQAGGTQKTYTWEVTVTADKAPDATLETTSVTVTPGATATAQVKVTDYTGATTYRITANKNDKIATATVDEKNGKITVTGKAAGDTTITVTVTMGSVTKTLDLAVKVTNGIKITLDKTAVTVYPKSTAAVTATVSGSGTITADSGDKNIATVAVSGKTITVTGVKKGTATITVTYKEGSAEAKATFTVTVAGNVNPREDTKTPLKDTSGRQLYVSIGDNQYRAAAYADYYTATKFFLMEEARYTGWQTLDGKVYFFKADGSKVTGEQVIQGAKYNFASDGSLVVGSGTMGIDVSKWNGSIDWNAVKNSGVNYVIIRVGYRGSSQGALIEDPKFKTNIKGATAAGLKVGVYFFTQAVDEVEAVQEASMVLDRISGYKISYPVFLDVEGSGGRGDAIDSATRTAVCKAFCNTIKNAGYTPGVYANKTWLTSKMDAGALSGYKIWLAQYAKTPTYTGRYDLWQYRSDGKVSGISGKVDLNISYLGY
ncbi:GH25 family lysozyme [Waltera intestinalis]|uniref:BIG2 domain-containing protein n=1 Tax=Waltera intestinalis TaxID=2606635 RepID=A0A6L5YJX9_9FIRM|nr:GH25 family lysozyme [Waltera intestinalis]MST58686.1 hypothetical protein [Waltera intestinalis]